MFTVNVRKNGKWKDVTISNQLFGELDLGFLNADECRELANDFRTAAEELERNLV